jgi:hypothetical protein
MATVPTIDREEGVFSFGALDKSLGNEAMREPTAMAEYKDEIPFMRLIQPDLQRVRSALRRTCGDVPQNQRY